MIESTHGVFAMGSPRKADRRYESGGDEQRALQSVVGV